MDPLGLFVGVNRAAAALGEAPARGPLHSINPRMNRGAPRSNTQNPNPRSHDPDSLSQRPQMDSGRNVRRFPTYEGSRASYLSSHRDLQTVTMDDINDYARRAASARAEAFLSSLKPLSLMDLPKNNRDCPICLEPYLTPCPGERPVRLPCHHVMGKDCLQKWVKSDVRNRNNNACPYCRTLLFERYAIPVDDDEPFDPEREAPSYSDFLDLYGPPPSETGNDAPVSAEYTGERDLFRQRMRDVVAAMSDDQRTPEPYPARRQPEAADHRVPPIYIPDHPVHDPARRQSEAADRSERIIYDPDDPNDPIQPLRSTWLSRASAASREAMPGIRAHAEDVPNVIQSRERDHPGLRAINPASWAPFPRRNPHAEGTYNPIWTGQMRGTHHDRYDQNMAAAWGTAPNGRAYAEEVTTRFQLEEYNRLLERQDRRVAESMEIAASTGVALPVDAGAAQAAVWRARGRAGLLEHVRRTNEALRQQRLAMASANLARVTHSAGFGNQVPRNQGPDGAVRRLDGMRNAEPPDQMMARTRGGPRLPPTYVAETRARNVGLGRGFL